MTLPSARRIAAISTAWIISLGIAAAGSAQASTIAFTCGDGVCTIDPDSGTQNKVVQKGRLAGLSQDGKTLSWVPEGDRGLIQANVDGSGQRNVYDKAISIDPTMSPDGSKYLWMLPGPGGGDPSDPFSWVNAWYNERYTVGAPTTEPVADCKDCTVTHGWLGNQSIGAFPPTYDGDPQAKICRIDAGDGENCRQVLARDSRGNITFPSGSPDRTEIVAALTSGIKELSGSIVRYSVATGQPIGNVTDGAGDSAPVYSPDGKQIAFLRGDQLIVKGIAGGRERVLATNADHPAWGGSAAAAAPPRGEGSTKGRVRIASSDLRIRRGRVAITLRCRSSRPCRGTLRLTRGKRTIGKRRFRIGARAATTVALRPSASARRTIRNRPVAVAVEVRVRGGKSVRRKLTLRG